MTKEQSPGIRKFELRWMKLVELDEFGGGGIGLTSAPMTALANGA